MLVEPVVESGAANSVAKRGQLPGQVVPSKMSLAGKNYRGPDGRPIENEGQQDVRFSTDEGHKCGMTWQVARVERPLIAVSQLTAAGNSVAFDDDGGTITHKKTGRVIKFARRGGVYVLNLWVVPENPGSGEKSSVFPRPGSS